MADEHDGPFLMCEILGQDVLTHADSGSRVRLLDERAFVKAGKPELQP